MKKSFIASAFIAALNFCPLDSLAQCSDAGICQIGGYITEEKDTEKFNLSASYKYGYGGKDYDIQYHSILLGGIYYLLDNSSVQLLFPYNMQSGPDGSVNGIGDLLLSWNQNLYSYKYSSLSISIGVKLPTGKDNKDNLPQAYQSGLGTTDMLIVVNYFYDKINIGAGYQLSGGRNNNISRLEKSDDILLRASYEISIDRLNITPQLLYIQPTSKSTVLNPYAPVEGNFVEVDKSNKSQINLLTELRYKIADNISLEGNFAVPFIKRETNVDGLTRAYSASLGLSYLFN
jgi:hypothetical protein